MYRCILHVVTYDEKSTQLVSILVQYQLTHRSRFQIGVFHAQIV